VEAMNNMGEIVIKTKLENLLDLVGACRSWREEPNQPTAEAVLLCSERVTFVSRWWQIKKRQRGNVVDENGDVPPCSSIDLFSMEPLKIRILKALSFLEFPNGACFDTEISAALIPVYISH
jgi:hypothetical protein